MTTSTVSITDHALVRLMERAGGVDVDGLREHMSTIAGQAVAIGAVYPVMRLPGCAPVRLCIERASNGLWHVRTVLPVDSRKYQWTPAHEAD